MKKHIEKLIKAGLISDTENNGSLARALDGTSKLDAVCNLIVERSINDVRLGRRRGKLVFCHYRQEIDEIAKRLRQHSLYVETFDGRTSAKDRNRILTEECDVLILQIKTGCEGLNLQQFQEVYFVSPHWNPAVEDQAVARCHRIGQREEINVFRFEMVAFDDYDETQTLDCYSSAVQDVKRGMMTMLDTDILEKTF